MEHLELCFRGFDTENLESFDSGPPFTELNYLFVYRIELGFVQLMRGEVQGEEIIIL